MSVITKFLFSLLFVLLPFQKQKDQCLIIYLKNNKELYNIGSIANRGKDFYITLKLTEVSNEKKREELNPILSAGVVMKPTSTSYNLQNRKEIENLPVSDKITDIYIMATTNGRHSSTSNHARGTAIDIIRINGQKMILIGSNNQIRELQDAFDDFPNVRENFGPYFKHKYSVESDTWNYSHPIGGHQDHIHFSVR